MSTIMHGRNNPGYKHGGSTPGGEFRPEYNSWRAMIARCTNPQYWAYRRYGGRGIKVSERWLKFENFLEDMGRKPTRKYSLDRIDTDGDYTPQNCRWATQKTQMRHTMRSRFETIDTETRTVAEWCELKDIKVGTVYNRLGLGWSFEKALNTPVNPIGVNFYNLSKQ